jgi:pyridoxine/pyridoxamine 5'-phosphate oxidase
MARGESFTEEQLIAREPLAQFHDWFEMACQVEGIEEPNAMCIATASKYVCTYISTIPNFNLNFR